MIILVMGVSGAGKSTLAKPLAERLGADFVEADDLHPATNVAKMRAGIPLTDADRMPWLAALTDRLAQMSRSDRDVVLACSALKLAYRQQLMAVGGDWLLIFLRGDPDTLRRYLAARHDHYMPAALLESQLATLEPPLAREHPLVLEAHHAPAANLERAVQAVTARRAAR